MDLKFTRDTIRVVAGKDDVRMAPSIDRAISSAADVFGKNMIAVLLTGMLDDGVEALQDVFEHGGTTIIQHPNDAEFSSMPEQAILRDHPTHILPMNEIPAKLIELTIT